MSSASSAAPARSTSLGTITALCVVGLAVYWRVFSAGFVWDDAAHVTAPALRTGAGLARIWFEPGATQQYYPLLHSFFWLEHQLWGDAALGYHLANLALHVVAAGLFAAVLRRLQIPGAFLAALLFLVHPVHVESAAWISEQKNTLSLVFYLGAALAYLRFDATRSGRAYFVATLLFLAALLTKSVTATLPAALLVVAWWRRGRLTWRDDVQPLLPWFTLGIAAGVTTAWFERTLIGAEGAAYDLSLGQRLLLSGRVVWFYLGKLAWPADLTFIYPRWKIAADSLLAWLPLLAALIVIALLWLRRARSRAPLAATLLFVGGLFPVLGFFNVYPFRYSFVADHFVYLPSLALFAAAGAGLARRPVAVAALVLTLGSLTAKQTQDYRDARTLMQATLARNPACWMAWNNLGEDLMKAPAGRAEALRDFERALALEPACTEARNNLGLVLTQLGRPADAIPHLERAVREKPRLVEARNNLGIALASSGRAEEALVAFAQAAVLAPRLPNVQENWAKALLLLGRRAEAEEHFEVARRLRGAR